MSASIADRTMSPTTRVPCLTRPLEGSALAAHDNDLDPLSTLTSSPSSEGAS